MMETRLKEVLAIVNNKGGVGKTTTVQSLAVAMKREHPEWQVLVIDLDPQGDLTKLVRGSMMSYAGSVTEAMASDNGKLTVYKSKNGIYYVPSSPELQKIEPKLMDQMQPYMVLDRLLQTEFTDNTPDGIKVFGSNPINPITGTIYELFDYVLIDCPPALSMCTYNAMAAASGLLVPVQMEGLSVSGLAPVIVEMERVKRGLNPRLKLRGILPVMVDQRPNISRSFIAYLEQSYGDSVTTTIIPRSVKVNEAQTKKKDIYEYKQWSPVAIAYEQLAKELFG